MEALKEFFGKTNQGKWWVYGPIGVDSGHHGQGIAPKIFKALTDQLRQKNEGGTLVGFVDPNNQGSLKFHCDKLGFKTAGSFYVNGKEYFAITYELK